MHIKSLKYLEALKIIENSPKLLNKKKLNLLASGEFNNLQIFFKAEGILNKYDIETNFLPFDSLHPHLMNNSTEQDEIITLFPWDFIPSLDWRTGIINPKLDNEEEYNNQINFFFELLKKRKNSNIVYIPAFIPPLSRNQTLQKKIQNEIEIKIFKLGGHIYSNKFFNLDNYLFSGCPLPRELYSAFSKKIIEVLLKRKIESKKIIITDLDFTYWHGILGEDGIQNITASPEGKGFMYFIYQTMLKRLKDSGVLISIVSKNDKDLVLKALSNNNFILKKDDFVSICANYQPKSLQIKELIEKLNIGMEHVVFIDDNFLEIEEVSKSLPKIECITFPKQVNDLIFFLNKLNQLFNIENITSEDLKRTELYQNMQMSEISVSGKGYDLFGFLKSLSMQLNIYKNNKDISRATQLINKTNQFNQNGIRREENEIKKIIKQGGHIFTGELLDKNGNHGEVLVLLIDKDNVVLSFVMSCRVFDRKAEYVFLYKCLQQHKNSKLLFKKTDRNTPFYNFLLEIYPKVDSKELNLNKSNLQKHSNEYKELFKIKVYDS